MTSSLLEYPNIFFILLLCEPFIFSISIEENDVECARGLASFSSIEIDKIKGSHSSKIENILGYSSREEIIHKDDLVKV